MTAQGFHPAWLSIIMRILGAAPAAILGTEALLTEAPGSTKKQLAMDSLNVAGIVAQSALPENQQTIAAAQNAASQIIDSIVSIFNHPQGNSVAAEAVPVNPNAA